MVSYFPPLRQCLNKDRVFDTPKQVTRIAPMKHLSRKKHWPYVKTGYLRHFYVFYHYHIISFRKVLAAVLWYQLTRKEHPRIGVGVIARHLLPNSQYICRKYVIKDEENPQPEHCKNHFQVIKVKIAMNF